MLMPLVAIPTDVKNIDDYKWHATLEQYLTAAISVAKVFPVLIPSFGAELDMESLLDKIDGVILSGAKSNVHPSLYGQEAQDRYEPYDQDRDATTFPLIKLALEKGIPLLAICRGMQELNVALGGSLDTEIQDREGHLDHRGHGSTPDERYALQHKIEIEPKGCLANILGVNEIIVNSLHRQAVKQISPKLNIEAMADDGIIEAVSVIGAKGFAVGVQWHPEYWAESDCPSRRILEAFGKAVYSHAELRK